MTEFEKNNCPECGELLDDCTCEWEEDICGTCENVQSACSCGDSEPDGDEIVQQTNVQLATPEGKQTGVVVQLTGQDGNAFAVLGRVHAALKAARVPQAVIDEYTKAATGGDYNHLLRVTMDYVDVR